MLNEYLHLEEFLNLPKQSIKGKRLALTQHINYLGYNRIYKFLVCLNKLRSTINY